ncbi:hypothetical protein E4O00_09710 [Treponema sp. OMZ 788]|uniref:hypothetical protein n=1 Tax=Treponema sp. OMZ 788 TaxID=2563664 RepID=UPI0020A4F1B0|nr:hypothetical protein [Treponema sp. OMZ 788]UTC64122.1 hypothetical protein E4O00_09710 [Treponema sp. OMZ 788]
MSNDENTLENNEEVKLLDIKPDADGNLKSEPITLNDGTKVEFVADFENEDLTKTKIFRDLQAVEEDLCGTHDLTNHADTTDYLVSVGCGILCGLIDSFFVGEFDFARGKEWSNEKINNIIIKSTQKLKEEEAISRAIAKAKNETIKNGRKLSSDNIKEIIKNEKEKVQQEIQQALEEDKKNGTSKMLASSIHELEQKYPIAADSVTSNFGGGLQHHLRDFTHHPTPVGLFFSLLSQFTEKAYGTNTAGLFQIVDITDKTLIGKNIQEKFYFGVIHWFFHMMSDMAGSSGTVAKGGYGTGLPGPILSLLKELSSLSFFKKMNKDGNKEVSVWISKLFNGTLLAQHDENGKIISGTEQPFDLRAELAVGEELGRQTVPVIINECLVRGFYFIRRLIIEFQSKNISNFTDFNRIDLKEILPFKNRTIVRMLTISKGTFEIFDTADAAIRSGGFTNMSFLLHLNFVGAVSFGITAGFDIKMGVQKFKKEHAYGCPKNLKLIRLYKKNAGGLSKVFETVPIARKNFGPLFIHINEKQYEKTNIKVMFVDMENHLSLTYDESMQTPKKLLSMFEMYKDYKFSPANAFGNFAKKLTHNLNTSQNNPMFIWNSIYKFSKPNKEIETAENQYFNLLLNEIKICKPDAVIFMTGKKYDKHIQAKFNNELSFRQICVNSENSKLPDLTEKCFAKLVSNNKNLPEHIYRISKPNSLFFKLFRKKATVNWLIKLILGIEPEEKWKTHKKLKIGIPWKVILIIPAIIILLLLLRTCKGCNFNEKAPLPVTSSIETPKIQTETKPVHNAEKVFLKETKSFEFRADRRDFVNPQEAEIWFDNMAQEIKTKLRQNPKLKFKICGYVAEFQNEIDEMVLAKERAENIKKGLVKRGIPSDILVVIPIGKTSRWGTERRLNRAVTIESFEE